MNEKFKVSESTTKMIDALKPLYEFFDTFQEQLQLNNIGGVALERFEKAFQDFKDQALLCIAYKMEDALVAGPYMSKREI